MTKVYRKVNSQMNRPKYGIRAKVVKQSKTKLVLVKPKVMELKKIYSTLAKSATWQRKDIYARAIQWYRNALLYIEQTGAVYSAPTAKHLKAMRTSIEGNSPNYVEALSHGSAICIAHGIKAPSVKEYLKKSVVSAKKLDAKGSSLTTKYDKLLTLLTQAYGSGLTLKVSPTLSTTHKFDHELNTLYYSTGMMQSMSQQFRAEGLLPLVIDEAWYVARALNFEGLEKGLYIQGSTDDIVRTYQQILHEFVDWGATSQFAPKSLLKRVVVRKKKSKKVAPEPEATDEASE